jgi:hypothetical protein
LIAVIVDDQAPLKLIKQSNGPRRRIGHVRILWDHTLHNDVGKSTCSNSNLDPCPWHGFVRHAGKRFSPFLNTTVNNGIPVTARGDVAGPTGGYGWILNFNTSAPRTINFTEMIIHPESPLIISIPYPMGTKFQITAVAASCWDDDEYVCHYNFTPAKSMDAVRTGPGGTYFVDNNGVISFRLAQTAIGYVGNATNFLLPNYATPPRKYQEKNVWAMERFERAGVLLPHQDWGGMYSLQAQCPGDINATTRVGYCSEPVYRDYDPYVCPPGYFQIAYDKCCNDVKNCVTS